MIICGISLLSSVSVCRMTTLYMGLLHLKTNLDLGGGIKVRSLKQNLLMDPVQDPADSIDILVQMPLPIPVAAASSLGSTLKTTHLPVQATSSLEKDGMSSQDQVPLGPLPNPLDETIYLPHAPVHLPRPPRLHTPLSHLFPPTPPRPSILEPMYMEIPSSPNPSLTSDATRPLIRPRSRPPTPPPPRDPLPPLPLELDMQRLQREVLMMETTVHTLEEAFRARHRSRRRERRILILLIFLLLCLIFCLMLFTAIKL